VGYVELGCRLVIGIVLTISAFSKLRSPGSFRAFARWLASLPIPGTSARPTAGLLIAAETTIVLLLVPARTATVGLALAALVFAVFSGGIWAVVRRGATAPCRCFGTSFVPLGRAHVLRNIVLCLIAVTGAAGSGRTAMPPAGIILTVAVAAAAAVPVLFLDDLLALIRPAASTHQPLPAPTIR
jgi:hypothetical protein